MTGFAEKIYASSPIFIQNLLVSLMGYKLYYRRYTGSVAAQIWRDLERIASMDRQQIESFQNERLAAMIKHCAAHVPYYQQLFATQGIQPSDINGIADLHKLPVLKKDEVRKYTEQFRSTAASPFMVQNTSGTTGTPLSLWVDEYTYKLAMALLVQHEKNYGVEFGDRRATFAGRMIQPISSMKPPFSRYNRAENQRIFSSYHLNTKTFGCYEQELNKFAPKEIIGYPSSIYELAFQYKQHNKKPTFKPTAIITNSETLLGWQRELIEEVFDVQIRDYYGTAEYITFAGQCSHGHYHLNPLLGITEITDDNGVAVTDVEGIVTTTTLTNYAMPLLRYQIGDRAALSLSACPCGDATAHLTHVLGRMDDVVITSQGTKIGRLDHIFKGSLAIKEAQIVQKSPTLCHVRVVKADANTTLDLDAIKTNLIERTATDMQVEVLLVDQIEKTKAGKFKGVINEMLR